MQLEEFYRYKNTFMKDILTDPEIVHLINEKVSVEDSRSLIFKQVFPYEYIPETVEEGHTFICCDVDIQRQKLQHGLYYYPVLLVWVFSHKSKLSLPEGGVRTDELCSAICRDINGSKSYGLGELSLDSVRRFAPMTDYQGKVMVFSAVDISKYYNPKTPIPANRRNP